VGDIDLAAAPAIQTELQSFADSLPDGAVLRVDCREVEFIDSAGLAALVYIAQASGRTVFLIDVSPQFRRVLEVTKLDRELVLVESMGSSSGSY
jgi:anti-anti-sigma factor